MKKTKVVLLIAIISLVFSLSFGQQNYWQQKISYKMEIDVDVHKHRLMGIQKLSYTNNSPDTLKKVYYHLYWNAAQPNSTMSVRATYLNEFKENEIGYQKIKTLRLNGVLQKFIVQETVLEVVLSKPILPKSKVVFDMTYETQVPLFFRRAGRLNNMAPGAGIDYTMGQWYPKMAAYDKTGWNLNPYVGDGEFYGQFGDYDVTINIDRRYILGGTGYLQNPDRIGYGYEKSGSRLAQNSNLKFSWHFKAPNVPDFMWCADKNYVHIKGVLADGKVIHALYKTNTVFVKQSKDTNELKSRINAVNAKWKGIVDDMKIIFPFLEKHLGSYPYKQYSFIHGGLQMGGMEYPMGATISSANFSTAVHELIHSWYPMTIATNEAKNAWMDEGFTSYATGLAMDYYRSVTGKQKGAPLLHAEAYDRYFRIAKSNEEEPLAVHADHFETNSGYACGSYGKGAVFLEQLGYIVGASVRDRILLEYYRLWKFKHPDINDFIRVSENVSGMKLDWYQDYFINTIKTIDYGIDSLWSENDRIKVRLKRNGKMPMPIDLVVKGKDGTRKLFYIPMSLMYGVKPNEDPKIPVVRMSYWKFNAKNYELDLDMPLSSIAEMEIDPSQRMADINRDNNKVVFNK